MVDQGFLSTQFGETQQRRKRDGEREQPHKENKKVDKKERKTARLFAPTCLDLKEERGGRQRLADAWEDLKRGA